MSLDTPQSPFDTVIDRRGTACKKWDFMERLYGVPADDGISMWVADMDFRAPPCVLNALQQATDHGVFGYYGGDDAYKAATRWWMQERHGWHVEDEWIQTTQGLVNAIALLLDVYTAPGDSIALFTPVYHAFARTIEGAGRKVVELPLIHDDTGRYTLDFDAYDTMLDGSEKMVIFCSPHNPVGRVWSEDELKATVDFATRHDLLLVSDEIHHDLVMPGHRHIPMPHVAQDAMNRLIMLTAPSKTFNIAALATGNVIIPDATLRAPFEARIKMLSMHPNMLGMVMQQAAYSPEGAAWCDDLVSYLHGNITHFAEAVAAIPGARMSPMESTYLAWVDFSGTGMSDTEISARVAKDARIAANAGTTFGTGGARFLRFNLATPRSVVAEAGERLAAAFSDLQ